MIDTQRVIKILVLFGRKNGAKWPQKTWFWVGKTRG